MVAGFIRFFFARIYDRATVRSRSPTRCFLPPSLSRPSISVPRRSTSNSSSSMSLKNTVFQRERYSFKEPAEPCQLFDPVVR